MSEYALSVSILSIKVASPPDDLGGGIGVSVLGDSPLQHKELS